jgi:hypothetical protein
MTNQDAIRETAAREALNEVAFFLKSDPDVKSYEAKESSFDNEAFIKLLDNCFNTLDPDHNGISRTEVMAALLRPDQFSKDEYVMISLLAKYFDLIANMSDDEPGEETVITRRDKDTLTKSLTESDLNLAELHLWCFTRDGKVRELTKDIGLPPMA